MIRLLALFTIIFSFSTSAQTKGTAKIYGYKQAVLPGAQREIISLEGDEVKPAEKDNFNYYIFLSSPGRAYPVEIWIDGVGYSAKMETVSTPVELTNNNIPSEPGKVTLVPKTSNRVIHLTPVPAIETKQFASVKKLAGKNELVVLYKMNGKFYYESLQKFSILDAAAMQ